MKGWRAEGPVIFMPITRDVVLRHLPTAIVPKAPKRVRVERGVVYLLH